MTGYHSGDSNVTGVRYSLGPPFYMLPGWFWYASSVYIFTWKENELGSFPCKFRRNSWSVMISLHKLGLPKPKTCISCYSSSTKILQLPILKTCSVSVQINRPLAGLRLWSDLNSTNCEEGWAPKNWCFWTVVLEKTLESSLDCKEIQPVHSEGDQPWDFFGRTDAKAETPVLWPPHVKSWLIGKDSDAGRDWGQEVKGMTEDEMVGWHHWLDGHEFE